MNVNPPKLNERVGQLIATPSVSSVSPAFDQSNRDIINLLANWLENLGFAVEVQVVDENPAKANLIARLGEGIGGLVLAGHTDTVPYDKGRWEHDPFQLTESDNRWYGLGVTDMKAFLAMAIEAASHFKAKDLTHPLTILATADEESSMSGAKALSSLKTPLGRYCVIGEPTNLKPVRQHKGVMMEAIILRGQSGHSSNPALGKNALDGMHLVISELMKLRNELAQKYQCSAFDVPTPTLNLGHIHGGDNPNRICGECELHIDLRLLPGMSISDLRRELRHRVSNAAWESGLECNFRMLFEGIPAMETDKNSHIVKLAESLTEQQSQAVAFGTEAPYLNELGCETIILGPGDIAQAHQADEYLSLNRITPMMDLLDKLIHGVCIKA